MLELSLTLAADQVQVIANAKDSHTFPASGLSLTQEQMDALVINPASYGAKIFDLLFKKDTEAARQLLQLTDRRIGLRVDSAELTVVPWEYLHDGHSYLAVENAFVRLVTPRIPPQPVDQMDRGRLLFVPSDPLMFGDKIPEYSLGVEKEWEDLDNVLRDLDAGIDLLKLPPTFDALQNSLAGLQNGIIHFTGHGGRDEKKKEQFVLFFERKNAVAHGVPASQFLSAVRGRASLVVLSACMSGAFGRSDDSNLACALAEDGIPFVLGMQLTVPDGIARQFTDKFYRFLFAGDDIFEAARQARLAVLNEPSTGIGAFLMGIPVLYASTNGTAYFKPSSKGYQPPETRVRLAALTGAQTGAFFGRQREMVEVGKLLGEERRPQNHTHPPLTVTLHGPGGIGKTALLMQAAMRFAWMFRDGVLAILLEPLPSPASLLDQIEKFIGAPDRGLLPIDQRMEQLLNDLQGRKLLIALDNFESLNHAKTNEERREDAFTIFKFLEKLPALGLTFLVSSRDTTGLPGETLVDVPGLDDHSGGQLFMAAVTKREKELTRSGLAKVNQRVGGHPLALRLLAPTFNNGSGKDLDDFTAQIDQLLPQAASSWNENLRHDTLKACFDFSLENLENASLYDAIAKLSLFKGQFIYLTSAPLLFGVEGTLEAGNEEQEKQRQEKYEQTNQTLLSLYEHGLLERTILIYNENDSLSFYSLHPALQPFAQARLTADTRAEAENAYWRSMDDFAGIAEEQVTKSPLMARVTLRAMPDLLLAAEIKSDQGAALMQFRVSKVLRQFGNYDDALRLLEKSRDTNITLENLKGKSATLHEMAYILRVRGDLDGAMKMYQQSQKIDEGLGDLQGKSATLHAMAYILRVRGDLDGAMKMYQQSLEIKEGLGDLQGKSATLHAMAYILRVRGDLDGAMKMYQQSQEILEGLGDLQGKSATLHEMAYILRVRGDLDGAMKMYQQSQEILEGLGDLQGKSATLHAMAYILRVRGDLDGAMKMYQQSQEILEGLGDLKGKSATLHEMAYILRVRGDLDGAMKMYQQSQKIDEGLGDLQGKSATLHAMAYILRVRGDLDGAMKMYQQSQKIDEGLGDLQGKSATLHAMAYILRVRGDLDGAMKMYQQSLEIKEGLGDLQGKSATLAMLGQLLISQDEYPRAILALVESLQTLSSIGARPDAQKVAEILISVRQQIGAESFNSAWSEVIDSPLPDWLTQPPQQEQGMTAEQFISGAIRSSRERRPEAEQFFKEAQKLAGSTSAPAELQELGKVLQRILLGNTGVDLSALPPEFAALIQKELE